MQGFEEGYKYFQNNTGDFAAATLGEEYIEAVDLEIDKLVHDLKSFEGFKTDPSKLQGDIAEFWHAGTFDIQAVVHGSEHRAFVDRSHEFASADISTNFGDKYGLKYYNDGAASAKAQAKSVFERYKEYQYNGGTDSIDSFLKDRGYTDDSVINDPIYTGQKRLIPRDQLEAAKEWLERKIAKESTIRPEQVKRYKETLKMLTDRLDDGEGTASIPLSREEAQQLAELAKQGRIDPKELGLTTEELVTYEYILQQAFKSGLTAATISFVLKVAPEILNAINQLIQNGEISGEQFKRIGFAAIHGTAEGFIRGTISAGITAACKAGLWGEAAKAISPTVIGMAVVLVMDTMKNSYNVAIGKMTKRQMADDLIKETFIASVSLLSGTAMQTILPEIPVVGFMLGSFAGSIIGGFAYSTGYNLAISFCIDTGFTMFGLVRQDYVLPEDVIREIGVSVFKPSKYDASLFEPASFEPSRFEPTRFEKTEFRPFFLRRGVIGIREIGYV